MTTPFTTMLSLKPLVFVLLTATLVPARVSGTGQFRYLGCYQDSLTTRDLNGKEYSFSTLSVSVCAAQCIGSGYPYIGLQLGSLCFCGSSYDSLGPSIWCNQTCGPSYCGGYLSNDVYYAVDGSIASSRALQAQSSLTSWTAARAMCVTAQGDLATVDTITVKQNILAAISVINKQVNESSITSAWIGLFRSEVSVPLFQWTNENIQPYADHPSDFTSFWDPSDELLYNCVYLNVSTGLLQTSDCSVNMASVCLQIPPAPPAATSPTLTTTTTNVDGISAYGSLLAFYIVLPVFFFCYGGSCLVYCSYKIYRACLRIKKKQNMELEKAQQAPPPIPQYPAMFHAPMAHHPIPHMGGMAGLGGRPPTYFNDKLMNCINPAAPLDPNGHPFLRGTTAMQNKMAGQKQPAVFTPGSAVADGKAPDHTAVDMKAWNHDEGEASPQAARPTAAAAARPPSVKPGGGEEEKKNEEDEDALRPDSSINEILLQKLSAKRRC